MQKKMTFEEYQKVAEGLEFKRTSTIGTATFHINDPIPYNGFYDVNFISFENSIPDNFKPAKMVDRDCALIGLSGSISVNFINEYALLLDPDESWRKLTFWTERFSFLATLWFHLRRHVKPDRDYLMLLEARYYLWDLDIKATLYEKETTD